MTDAEKTWCGDMHKRIVSFLTVLEAKSAKHDAAIARHDLEIASCSRRVDVIRTDLMPIIIDLQGSLERASQTLVEATKRIDLADKALTVKRKRK